MIGFEYNHPDFPFVLGGMFHGKTGLGGGIQNHMRSIQTKSGIKVLMNDNEKSVTILDPSGNTYFMDGNGNITVTAPKNITFNAGDDINIIAGKNFNTNVGDNANTNIGKNNSINIKENYDFQSNNYQQNINKNKNVNVSGDLEEISATAILKAISGDILIQSAGISTVLGAIDAKVNKG